MNASRLTRRQALATAAGAALAFSPALGALAAGTRRFRISACDWSLGQAGNPEALRVAAEIGLDGVQVSFGAPGAANDLRTESAQRRYREAAREHGVEVSSLAMGILNSIPYASSPEAEKWVVDCVDVMAKMGQKVVLLAFFSNGDINGRPELQQEVISRLKKVAPAAEKAGVSLGIESWMSADDHLRILDAVGSPAVRVYYDVANSEKMGYDIYKEIRQLGRERICEIHCKENESLLGKGRVDFVKVREAIDDIGWSGWLVLEGAMGKGMGVVESYTLNQRFLRSVFST